MKRAHQAIGGFRLLRSLGSGPRCASHLAVERGRRRPPRWVLKEILIGGGAPHEGRLLDRLREDFLDLASLSHPSLALPAAVIRDGPRAYLLRPYLPGWDILTASQGKAVKELLPWLVGSAKALGVLHRSGFLHRNLKPSNLHVPGTAILARSPRDPRIVLSDPAWWPEESSDEGRATFATDLHALGAIFYEIVTRKAVDPGGSGFPPRPSELNPEVPLDLERSIMRLLNPEPSRRYQSAASLVDDLLRLFGERVRNAPLAPSPAPECFLDRAEELRQANASLEPGGRPAVVAVSGEAGMGKSAFLRRLTLEAQVRGFRTVSARCFPENSAPLGPIQALAEGLLFASPGARSLLSRYRRLLRDASGGERRMFIRGLLDIFTTPGSAQPALLVLDEAHLADSLSIEFLAGLIRDLAVARGKERERVPSAAVSDGCRLSLAFSFRTESPFRGNLRPVLEALSSPGESHLHLELPPLPSRAVDEWLNLTLAEPEGEGRDRIALRLKGHPLSIREAVRFGGSSPGEGGGTERDLHSLHAGYLSSLDGRERRLLEVLAILGRPASAELLADLLTDSRRTVLEGPEVGLRPAVERLLGDGTLSDEGGLLFFRHGSFQAWLLKSRKGGERRSLHRRIAAVLERRREPVEEIAHHWIHSDAPRDGVPFAIEAARRLSRNHEDRRALVFYGSALDHLPPGDPVLRAAIAEEAAEAHARIGEHRGGLSILKRLLGRAKASREAGRLHGRIGVFCHRAGEVSQATYHLERGLSLLAGARGPRWLEERLSIESELAEVLSNRGEYGKSEAICRRALVEIEKRKEAGDHLPVRRKEMALLENLAHLRLRLYRFEEARELFERSLRAGEGLGPVPEKSLILNNLGILHIQENRFPEAIECYRRAEKLSSRLGDDQSLAAIQSNLAVLHAKSGEPEAAEEAIRKAVQHDSRCNSRRTSFLRLHSAGMVDLIFGRYSSAIEAFGTAISLGEELKDVHTRAFDLVYLGECHLYRGESTPAKEAFERALGLGPPLPAPIKPMVEARKALLAAQRGDARGARASFSFHGGGSTPGIPYLESWNAIFLGWAHRLLGQWDEAEARLKEAREFFARVKSPGGEIHTELELAALEADTGRGQKAIQRLKALRGRATSGQGALRNPMLSARLLAYETRLLLDGKGDLEEAASLLVEAESYLIGRRVQDLETLVRELRRRVRRGSLEARTGLTLPSPPGNGVNGIEDLEFLRGTASDLVRRYEEEIGERRAEGLRRHLRDFEARLEEARRSREEKRLSASPAIRADSIVGSSPAIRKMVSLILQVAPSTLPVLITGETGTGKELVARAIHGESPRRSAPFVSLSSAALPAELLEAELFGYLRGAFSGAEEDRPGLLRSAHGGTFLFDEIGEMPLGLQGKVLRVLERGRLRPLGGVDEVEVDVRYLFTTHRNLEAMMETGEFRRDLFFRLKGLEVAVPPLRERLEDLPELVGHFRAQAGADRESAAIGESALRALASHRWPGNVRELGNAVARLVLTSTGRIGAEEVRSYLGNARAEGLFSPLLLRGRPLGGLMADLEKEYLLQLHADKAGDLEEMAGSLGIKVRALYDRLRRLGIRPRELR